MSKDKAPGCDDIPTEFFQERSLSNLASSVLSNAQKRGNLRADQQRIHHSDPQIGGSGQNWKLVPNHPAGQFIQDPRQNSSQAASDLPLEYIKAHPDWFCRGEVYSRQHLPGTRSLGLGKVEQPRLSPLTPRLREGLQ